MGSRILTRSIQVAALAALLLVAGASVWTLSTSTAADEQSGNQFKSHARQLSHAFRNASNQVLPTLVTIRKIAVARPATEPQARLPQENQFRGTPFEDFFKERGRDDLFRNQPSQPRGGQLGMGSGFVIDPSGIILTNNHVVDGRGKVRVQLADGREFDAVKVKTDPRTDLAVVWIEGAGPLKSASLGDSDRMEIGDWVLAVGNPLGLYKSVTAGIISAKGRGIGIADREEFLQTDAAINPGNSGGPLINLDGEVVGINTAISSRTGGYQGAGFAIPSNMVRWVTDQLISEGGVQRAYLGTVIQPVTPTLANQFGVEVNSGVLISDPLKGSPAAEAGLQSGDIVTQFGNKKVTQPRELQSAVETAKIGSFQLVKIIRDGKPMTLKVKVRTAPKDYGLSSVPQSGQPSQSGSDAYDKLGLEVTDLSEEAARKLGLGNTQGVVITGVQQGTGAAQAGLKPGMAITQVNRKSVKNLKDFAAVVKGAAPEDGVLLLVRTESGSRFVVIRTAR